MSLPPSDVHPNPEVYRLAARLIDKKQTTFTCSAIRLALQQLYGFNHRLDLDNQYGGQYRGLFSSKKSPVLISKLGYARDRNGIFISFDPHHPYWNLGYSKERRQQRVLALLFMAEVVENGG